MTDSLGWTPAIWERINQAVHDEIESSAIVRKIVRRHPIESTVSVPGGIPKVVNNSLMMPEGDVIPVMETIVEFSMTRTQVQQELQMHTAATLAGLGGNLAGLVESLTFFQGLGVKLPPGVQIKDNGNKWPGILKQAVKSIDVQQLAKGGGYGPNTYKAVVDGIASLQGVGHYGPYLLALPCVKKADACSPLADTLVTPCDRIESLVEDGIIHGTDTLPKDLGFLLSRDGPGRTVNLAVGDARCEFTSVDSTGMLRFRDFVRWTPIVFDNSSFVTLNFV
jgi:hypothetical protein